MTEGGTISGARHMLDLLFFCLGGAFVAAVYALPLAYLALRSFVAFRGGLGQAWKPFGYSIAPLTIGKFIELATRASQDVSTLEGFVWFLVIPTAICAAVLFFTYRRKA